MKWLVLPLALALGTWILFIADRAPATDAALRGFPLDDGWIHAVYARALVEEGGFHYNTGQPETGMTSPLWVVLLAGVIAVTGPANTGATVLGAKILSLVFGLAATVLLYRLARRIGEGLFAATLAASLFALDPSVTFARASGMEVPLFIALVLASFWCAFRGQWLATGILAGLSVVARPEGLLFMPSYAIALLRAGTPRPRPRRALAAIGFAALPALAYSAYCLAVTGRPLPNTFYAKFTRQNPFDPSLAWFGWTNYVHDNLPWFLLEAGTLLAVIGLIRRFRRDAAGSVAVFAGGLVFFIASFASRTFAPGHFFYWERWIIPAFPFLHLAIAAGVAELRESFPYIARRRAGARAAGASGATRGAEAGARRRSWNVAAGLALVFLAVPLPRALRERADLFAWNAQNIEEMNVALGRWIDENLPPSAVIAVNDAGALRYFGRRTTIDLIGLNNHLVLAQDPALGRHPLDTFGVTHLVIFPSIFPELVQNLPLTAIQEVHAEHYTICDAPQDQMVVFRLDRVLPPASATR